MALFYKNKEEVYAKQLKSLTENYYSVFGMIPADIREQFRHDLRLFNKGVSGSTMSPEEAVKNLNGLLNGYEVRVSDLAWLAEHPEINHGAL